MRASETSHVEKLDWARVRYMRVAVQGRYSNLLLHCPFSLSRRLAGLPHDVLTVPPTIRVERFVR